MADHDTSRMRIKYAICCTEPSENLKNK
uniref:Uncharacterized protein n=1 Tax=Arundo donax TaxID=35708 RepID=A0A0A9BSB2_ARUDO